MKKGKKRFAVIVALIMMLSSSLIAFAENESIDVAQVSCGYDFTGILKTDGSLWMTGCNNCGMLGDGTEENKSIPVKIMDDVAQVSCGLTHTGILKTDGSLWMTGGNYYGALGDGTEENGDGTKNRSTPVKIMDGVAQVSCGRYYTGIVKKDGSLWMTGQNDMGQLGDGTEEDRCTPVKIMDGVAQVTCGGAQTGIIKTDGSLWITGHYYYDALGDGMAENRSTPVKIMDGVAQVCFGEHDLYIGILKTDGSLWMAGDNYYGQFGDGTNEDKHTPVKTMDGVAQVSCGYDTTGILKTDGSLWMTGLNEFGSQGDGSTSRKNTPVKIMDGVAQVSCGNNFTGIVKTDGSLWMTGNNARGQLGDGTNANKYTPVNVFEGGGGSDNPEVESGWNFLSDSYCFQNNFGYGEPIYISASDFADFVIKIDKTDITRLASWYGEGPKTEDPFLTSIKIKNFLMNNLRIWDGSCYGMSLTAALFKKSIKDPIPYGGPTTHSLPEVTSGTNTPLESFVNVYHITQACAFTYNTRKEAYIGSDDFSTIADDIFEKAKSVSSGKQELFLVDIWYDKDGDQSSEEGHTVVCYGGESGYWTINDLTCDRRLVVADPNLDFESYIYISKDSHYMFYPYQPNYNGLGYNTASLSDLNTYSYNDSTFNQMTLLDILSGTGAVIKGNSSGGQLIIKDGTMTVLNESDVWHVDSICEVCDAGTGKEANVTYRIFGDTEDLTIEPLEGEKLCVGIVIDDFAADINGDITSAIIGSDGHVSLNDSQGQVVIDLARNDSELNFVQVHGDANGDITINLDTDKISVSGDTAGYTVSNMDLNLNKAETTIQTNEETVIPANDLLPADSQCIHEWNSSYTIDAEPSCTEEGTESIHCKKCGAIKEGSAHVIPKTAHSYTNWTTAKAATEMAEGQQTRTCSVCGVTETQTIAQLAPTLPAVKMSKPAAAKKSVNVKWKKVNKKNLKKIQGIEIQVATDSGFTDIVKTATAGKKKTSKKIKGLTSKQTYYVRIRAYKDAADGKHVSAWKMKKVKVK